MENIYDIDRNLELCKDRLKEDKEIPEEVKNEILKFTKALNRNGISKHRQYFYIERLKIITRIMGKRFLDPTPKDFDDAIDGLLETKVKRKRSYSEGEGYSERTISDVIFSLKRFYRDYHDGKYLEKVSKLKTNNHASKLKKPEELVTKEELNSLLKACINERDRALISMLYDSGCRIGELLTLKVKNVEYDQYGMRLTVSGKTGVRKVRVIGDSVALTRQYQERYNKKNPDDLFFTEMKGGLLKYGAVNTMLDKVSKRTGITKRIHCHLFRHTRATLLAKDLPEAPLEAQMGWVHGSKMSRVYVSLSGEQLDEAVLRVYGIAKKKDEKGMEYAPQVCSRCGAENPGEDVAIYCYKCGMPLGKKLYQDIAQERKEEEEFIMGSKVVDDEDKENLKLIEPEWKDKILSLIWKKIEKKGLLEEAARELAKGTES